MSPPICLPITLKIILAVIKFSTYRSFKLVFTVPVGPEEDCSEQEGEELSAVFPTIRNRSFDAPPLLVYFTERHFTVNCRLVLRYGSASLNRPSSGIPRVGEQNNN
jgi:hypothetical protein